MEKKKHLCIEFNKIFMCVTVILEFEQNDYIRIFSSHSSFDRLNYYYNKINFYASFGYFIDQCVKIYTIITLFLLIRIQKKINITLLF